MNNGESYKFSSDSGKGFLIGDPIALKQNKKNVLGEFVILIEGASKKSSNLEIINSSVDEQINKLLKKYSLTDVVNIVHKLTKISKKTVYKKALEQRNE